TFTKRISVLPGRTPFHPVVGTSAVGAAVSGCTPTASNSCRAGRGLDRSLGSHLRSRSLAVPCRWAATLPFGAPPLVNSRGALWPLHRLKFPSGVRHRVRDNGCTVHLCTERPRHRDPD